jgi:hypothetical protein
MGNPPRKLPVHRTPSASCVNSTFVDAPSPSQVLASAGKQLRPPHLPGSSDMTAWADAPAVRCKQLPSSGTSRHLCPASREGRRCWERLGPHRHWNDRLERKHRALQQLVLDRFALLVVRCVAIPAHAHLLNQVAATFQVCGRCSGRPVERPARSSCQQKHVQVMASLHGLTPSEEEFAVANFTIPSRPD